MTEEDDDGYVSNSRLVRPYMVMRGRTTASDLAVETMVHSLDVSSEDLHDEGLAAFQMCEETLAIAELAADLNLPVAITREIVVELLDSGHMEKFETADAGDVAVVTRILNALSEPGATS